MFGERLLLDRGLVLANKATRAHRDDDGTAWESSFAAQLRDRTDQHVKALDRHETAKEADEEIIRPQAELLVQIAARLARKSRDVDTVTQGHEARTRGGPQVHVFAEVCLDGGTRGLHNIDHAERRGEPKAA